MTKTIVKPEVLAPVGDSERLAAAIRYGADAVYLGGKQFGMRANPANFDQDELREGVALAHEHGVKVYLTCNTLPLNRAIPQLPDFLRYARDVGVDALIVADVGVLMEAKRVVPEIDIHISTQAGVVNYLTATELYHMGAKRVVLARELSIEDVKYIRDHTPPELEIETFVHGAMCMSFSGQCLLSNYMTGRDANRGECAQPCRWGYYLMEEKRPGEYYPVFEDERGSYILNATDLCMIAHIDQLVGVITNAYRAAVDLYVQNPEEFQLPQWIVDETRKVSHREYSTGFYFDRPGQCYKSGGYVRECDIVANVDGWENGMLTLTQRNFFRPGDTVEILEPKSQPVSLKVEKILSMEGEELDAARHPMQKIQIPCDRAFAEGSIVRKDNIV